jgi:diguanylate cyclase (GGDEF)-like protein
MHDETAQAFERDLTVINEMTKAVTSTLNLAEVVRIALSRIKLLASAEAISFLRYDAERDELVFAASETLRESTFDTAGDDAQGLATWVARSGRAARVDDRNRDVRCRVGGELSPGDGASLLAVPLWRDGEVAGVIEVADRYDGRPFDDADQAALEAVAVELAPNATSDLLARDPGALRALLARIAVAVPSQSAALLLYDPSGRGLTFSASRRLQAGMIDGLRMPADTGIAGWVARHREPLLLEDASRDPRWHRASEALTNFRPRAMLCVPVISHDTLHGVIQVMNRLDGRAFDARQLRLAQILADHTAIALENARLYRQAELAAITDDLTGLGNARFLNQRLPALLAAGHPLALLVLDFDNFKEVVDRYGHPIGGQTLAFLGQRIAEQLRRGDRAARFGGDEFAVLLPETSVGDAVMIADAIRLAIASAQRLGDLDIDISRVTASIGVAVFPEHAGDAVDLLRAADQAMFAVKRTSKNAVGVATKPGA